MTQTNMREQISHPVSRRPRVTPVVCLRSRAEAGITLLELLVSMTIVSLLATTALFAWRVGSSAWLKASERLEKDRTVLAVHQLVEEQMASMVPYQAWTTSGGREVLFQGEPQTARFVSRYSLARRAASGLYLIEYQVAEQADGTRQLLLNESPVWGNEELGTLLAGAESRPEGVVQKFQPFERGPQTVTLIEGLQECRFEYYRTPGPNQPGTWTDQWIVRSGEVPQAMRMHAVAAAGSGEVKPETMVAAVRNFSRRRPAGLFPFGLFRR